MGECIVDIVNIDVEEYHKQLREEILNSDRYTHIEIIMPTIDEADTTDKEPFCMTLAHNTNDLTLALAVCVLDHMKENMLKLEGVKEAYNAIKSDVSYHHLKREIKVEEDKHEQNNFNAGD